MVEATKDLDMQDAAADGSTDIKGANAKDASPSPSAAST